MRGKLVLSTSILALVCCNAVYAQTETPTQNSNPSSSKSGGVETVVVTAERRSTDLQKTAIAATVLSGEALQNKGVNVVDELQFIAPSLTIDNFGQGIDFDIRGIGKGEHNSQTTPGVITYRDGVATFPGYITEEPYYDVKSVEVLRGPQGTFEGQNAIGGAVLVTTNDPVIGGGYDGYVQAQAGNYYDFGLQGAVNLPIDDTLAARVAWYGENRSSFYDITSPTGGKYNGNPGDAHWGTGRLSLLWKPTDRLTVLWKTDFGIMDNGAYPADPYTDRFKYLPGTTTPNPFYEPDLFKIHANAAQIGQDTFVRSSIKADYVLPGGITLQSISGYQYGNTEYGADLYGNPNPTGPITPANPYPGVTSTDSFSFYDNVDEAIWSEEFDVISPDDKGFFSWIFGVYGQSDTYFYLDPATKDFVINAAPPGVPPGVATSYVLSGNNPERDLSAFGQVSFNLPAGFQLQVGGRYSSTTTKNDVYVDQYGLPLGDNQKAGSNNISYKVALNWTLDDDNFLYAFLATGFKPGGLNVPVGLGVPAPFLDETVKDYEVGWKSSFLDNHLRMQIDGYYDDFNRFQVSIGYPAFPTFAFEVNDPNGTKLYGFEGEAQAVFGDLSFDTSVGIEHSQLGTFFAADPRISTITTACSPTAGPASTNCLNLSGHAETYAPNFTFNVGVQYNINLDGGDVLTPRINYGHVGPQWATLFENPNFGDRLAERNILNAQLALTHGDYVFTLYGTNLTNDQYVGALNSNLDFAGPPRQYGIRILKTF
jgi:iron complex outermembrane receptor protein